MNNLTDKQPAIFNSLQQYKLLLMLFFACVSVNAKADMLDMKRLDEMTLKQIEEVILTDDVTTSSTGMKTKISKAPNTIKLFTDKDIARLNARTISDVLKTVAGVQIQTKNNNREKIWIRGSQSEFNNKIALYIDNVPYRNVFGGFPIDEEIPIESIKSIEVIKGPGSALYGANAFSGVINIHTFQPKDYDKNPDKNVHKKNLFKAGIGERGTALSYISLGHNFNDIVKVLLEGKWLVTDGRKPRFNNTGAVNNRTGDQELNHLRFKASALDDKLLLSASYNKFKNTRVDQKSSVDNSRTNENLRFSLSFEHEFNKMLKINLNAYYTNTRREELENSYNAGIGNRTKLLESFRFVDQTEIMGFKGTTTIKPSDDNEILLGMEYKRERLVKSQAFDALTNKSFSFISDPRYQKIALNDYSFFIQVRQNIIDEDTQFTAGLRFDKLDLFADQFSYRFGLTHAFTKALYIKLLYGTAYRAPNFVEFTRAPTNSPLPNVETMKTAELQLGYQSKTLRTDLTFYYNQYRDFIFRKNSFHESTTNLTAGVFSNVDNLNIIGVDFESKFKFDKNWSGFLNIGWLNARSLGQAQLMPLLTNWTIAAGVEWQMKFGKNEISFNNHVIGYSNRKDWDPKIWKTGQTRRHINRSNSLNDSFIIWNTGLHYKRLIGDELSLSIDLTVYNLLDTQYYTQTLNPPRSDRIANFDTQYQGRHGRLSVSLEF